MNCFRNFETPNINIKFKSNLLYVYKKNDKIFSLSLSSLYYIFTQDNKLKKMKKTIKNERNNKKMNIFKLLS